MNRPLRSPYFPKAICGCSSLIFADVQKWVDAKYRCQSIRYIVRLSRPHITASSFIAIKFFLPVSPLCTIFCSFWADYGSCCFVLDPYVRVLVSSIHLYVPSSHLSCVVSIIKLTQCISKSLVYESRCST